MPGHAVGRPPNLIVIGAQKCGTTSLHYYLGLHPDISMSSEKELNFFLVERNWHRGLDWYQAQFRGEAKIYGESSPAYTHHPTFSGVAERMHSVVPQARLIYLVRDPIERLLSHYVHAYAEGEENRSLDQALADLAGSPYVQRSRYAMQLEPYLKFFPLSRILVVPQEDLYRRRRETLREIFRFLGVANSFETRKFSRLMHRSSRKRRKNRIGLLIAHAPGLGIVRYLPQHLRGRDLTLGFERSLLWFFSRRIERPVIDEALRLRLRDYLKEDVGRLRRLTGQPFEGWCV
jgi:hypothetical protein